MMDLRKAQKLILQATPTLGRENVPVLEALGRVLARDIVVTDDFPASDISALDGYAVRHTSIEGASLQSPARLRIIGESPAGRPWGATVKEDEAVRIMTGGVVPEGADTVVKLEIASEDSGYVVCTTETGSGQGIRFRGEYLKKGDMAMRAGQIITPLEVGALATLRRAYVYVHRKPLVAVFSTGDELTDFHEPPMPWKTMGSSLYALAAMVVASGAVPLILGIVQDDLKAQQTLLSEALCADVIISSGGMSKGKYDLTRKAFMELGLDVKFSTLFRKPGKPTIFGTIDKSLIFGLPGNPSAAMLSFEQFIRPALLKMTGHGDMPNTAHGIAPLRHERNPFSKVDSFVPGGGNRGHERGSLVPLKRPLTNTDSKRRKRRATAGSTERHKEMDTRHSAVLPKVVRK